MCVFSEKGGKRTTNHIHYLYHHHQHLLCITIHYSIIICFEHHPSTKQNAHICYIYFYLSLIHIAYQSLQSPSQLLQRCQHYQTTHGIQQIFSLKQSLYISTKIEKEGIPTSRTSSFFSFIFIFSLHLSCLLRIERQYHFYSNI